MRPRAASSLRPAQAGGALAHAYAIASSVFGRRFVRAVCADREQQVLVQLHPHGVVGVEARRAQPLGVARVDASERGLQSGPVGREALDAATETRRDGTDTFVDRVQPIEHRPVVARVTVVVRNATGPELPVGADADELAVQREEPLVGAPREVLVLAARGQSRPRRVRRPTNGCDPNAAGAARDVTLADQHHDRLGLFDLDHPSQADLVQETEGRVVGRGHVEMVTVAARLHSIAVTEIGSGTRVFAAPPVRGSWRRLTSPDDVLELMDTSADGVVACVADAGATFLAPIFDELTAVVCLSGTPLSHIGIVSREYQVPCVMAAVLTDEPSDGDAIEVDCSGDQGVVRRIS